ncbi:tRNA pseudouridine(13) synthase TruD [Candidatus Uhrbacteria bacterium]|nr:tRNA pseudouridine(13) synthase TruD [Candidatus Uhrbacteria bacterium]
MQDADRMLFEHFQDEQKHFEEIKKDHPEFFIQQEHTASQDILERIGIFLPAKHLPLGYIKYHPFDFIVEEIQTDATVCTVEPAPLFSHDRGSGKTIITDLVKVGIATMEAERELARFLAVEKKSIHSAGIKDAYALTSQRVSIHGIPLEVLEKIPATHFFLKNARLEKGAISIGQLQGNRFTILVRTEHKVNEEEIAQKIHDLEKNGFWNFFWLQRFGNRLLTHVWGLYLFQGDYEGALRSYLCETGPHDLPYFQHLRQEAEENYGNWEILEKLFACVPYSFRYERAMISYLQKNPQDTIGALNTMPDQIKFWAYAYASYVFNRVLSQCASGGRNCTATLPLILTYKKEEQLLYRAFLDGDEVPNNFGENLRPFPYIRLSPRSVDTRIKPLIHVVKSTPEGVAISFDLKKGAYATTFLAHLFTLQEGMPPPAWLNTADIDIKELLGVGSLKETQKILGPYIVLLKKDTSEELSS